MTMDDVVQMLVEKVSGWLLDTPDGSVVVSVLAFILGLVFVLVFVLVFFFGSELKERISGKAGRREEGTSKSDDVRSPPSDPAPTGDHPQGSESDRVPEKRKDEAPEPALDLSGKPSRWRIAIVAVGFLLSLMFAVGGYLIAEQLKETAHVERLLAEAKVDLSKGRLSSPVGNNAWEKYQDVLSLFPGDDRAQAGMKRVLARYMELFNRGLVRGDWVQAGTYLSQIRGLRSDSPLLAEAERRLTKAEVLLVGEMVEILGGTFRMGDLSGEGDSKELPVHSVTVPSFWMGKYEVTLSQWKACAADGKCNYKKPSNNKYPDNHPVINVSWEDVQKFIAWLNARTGGGYRLPTESEWEYAARAGSESLYSWGDRIGVNQANCSGSCGDQWDKTAPVGSFEEESAWGLHDMHGNVWEWVEDCWNKNYRGAPGDGSAWLSGDCSLRVIRGGSWLNSPRSLRSSFRNGRDRLFRNDILGFRLARDL